MESSSAQKDALLSRPRKFKFTTTTSLARHGPKNNTRENAKAGNKKTNRHNRAGMATHSQLLALSLHHISSTLINRTEEENTSCAENRLTECL